MLLGAAAVELRALDPATAAEYLERVQLDPPPDRWRDLIKVIRANPKSSLTEALNNPLALTLIRDTYQSGDDARELLDQCDTIQQRISGAQAPEEITGHLLDRVLPAAYAPRPGQPPPRYDLQTAQNALVKIAARMNQDGTRDLQWWHIPRWTPSAPRIVVGGLVAWLLVGLVVGLGVGLVAGLENGLVTGLDNGFATGPVVGLVPGVAAGIAARGTSGPPARMGRIRRPRLRRVFTRRSLKIGLVSGLVVGLATGPVDQLVVWLVDQGVYVPLVSYLVVGLSVGFVAGLAAGLSVGLAEAFADPDNTSSPSPATSWRNDRRHAMAIGLVVGLVVGLLVWLLSRLEYGLMSILRTVGPVYQFRHARLQDRLAAASANGRNDGRIDQPLG